MEENFEELLDEYLDEKEINAKIKLDEEEIQKENKSDNTPSNFSIDDAMSIGKYVNNYLHISGNCSNLYLHSLKDLGCEYVIGVDNNFANKHPEFVYQGYLLLVIDVKHNRGTYINPYYIEKILNREIIETSLKRFSTPTRIECENLGEYYQEYQELIQEQEANEKFEKVIKSAHKVKRIKKLMEEKRSLNEKY